MIEFNFVKYQHRFTTMDTDVIHLNKTNINFGKKAYIRLGSPRVVDIYFDVKTNAIKFEPSENGRKISLSRCMSSTLSKLMPIGKYRPNKENIFILENKSLFEKEKVE